jgi:adenosylcobinamide-GDP ribazoletransferase
MTRIPVNMSLPCENEDFRRGTMFMPLIGLIIGIIQWGIFYLSIKVLPLGIVAVLVVLSGILVTGALHLDGLGDSCDGIFAFKGKDKIIEIMKDSRIGTYACIAIIFDILIKIFTFAAIPNIKASMIIIATPIIGRTSLVFLFYIGRCAKSTGSGNLFIGNVGKKQIITALSIGIALVIFLIGITKGSILIAVALIFTMGFNKYCNDKIGGLTGDTLGANNELVEMIILIIFTALSNI